MNSDYFNPPPPLIPVKHPCNAIQWPLDSYFVVEHINLSFLSNVSKWLETREEERGCTPCRSQKIAKEPHSKIAKNTTISAKRKNPYVLPSSSQGEKETRKHVCYLQD